MQPAQARVVDRARRLPAWAPPGRELPPRLRARLELGTYGWWVMLLVLGALGAAVRATSHVHAPRAWTDIVGAIGFLVFGLLAIGAGRHEGQRILRLLRLGAVDADGKHVYDPARAHDRLRLSTVPGDVVVEDDAVRMRRPISPAFLIAPVLCAAAALVLAAMVVAG